MHFFNAFPYSLTHLHISAFTHSRILKNAFTHSHISIAF